jgi:adenylate cyclase
MTLSADISPPANQTIAVKVYERGKLVCETQVSGQVEFGRQNEDETAERLYTAHRKDLCTRFLIAGISENGVSRIHLVLEPMADNWVRLSNRSRMPIRLDGGAALEKGTSCDVPLPVTLMLGERRLQFQLPSAEQNAIVSLSESSQLLGRNPELARTYATIALNRAAEGNLDNEALIKWVQAILGVLQEAAGTLDFFPRAARVVVLVRDGEAWTVRALQATRAAAGNEGWRPSRLVVARVLQEKKTCFLDPGSMPVREESLRDVAAVVAAPILDRRSEVIGILYGERRTGPVAKKNISRLEGLLVEMLASGIATGMARLEQEEKAMRAQVQMEQFFTQDLARHLAAHPEALQGRDVEVTLLSCDIRGFSRICERLAARPEQTLAWLNDVLGVLSDCVLDEQGVLVDYVGDELMNLWGAPEAQPDHAQRACRAALAMRALVPLLNERWQETVREPMGVRIGVSSGPARVGNVGSARKFKYGALGNTINLASRVQGAARHLRSTLLITEATQRQLDASFATRRLTQVRVVNIAEPVTLYELAPVDQPGWAELRGGYEEALARFEAGDFRTTTRILGGLLSQPLYRDDGPSLVLLQRAVTILIDEPPHFSPVWELPSK